MEGGIIQSASWTLYEQLRFDKRRVTSFDWSTYPILRFSNVPEHIDVHLIDRPGTPFPGAGEASQGRHRPAWPMRSRMPPACACAIRRWPPAHA